jgi:ribosomal 50S subunit-recycling heat shock protein
MMIDAKSLMMIHLLLFIAFSTGYAQIAVPIDREQSDQNTTKPREKEHDKTKPRYTREQIARALRKYAREPSAAKIVALAIENARMNPDKTEEMASRARKGGWLPVVKLAVRRGLAQDLAEYQTIETDRTSLSTDDHLTLEASLTFEFDRLIFDRSEVSIAREERSVRQARTELIRTVVTLYYERRRLQLERDLQGVSDIERELRIVEIEAMLNSFTNGAFGSMISNKQ